MARKLKPEEYNENLRRHLEVFNELRAKVAARKMRELEAKRVANK